MIRFAAPLIALLLVLPATAWACFGAFNSITYPSEFAIAGVCFGSLLRMLYGRRLENRLAFSRAIFLSSVIAGYGMGFFVASSSSPFALGGFTLLAFFFTLFGLIDFTTYGRRYLGYAVIVIITGFFTTALFDTVSNAKKVQHLKELNFQQAQEVRF